MLITGAASLLAAGIPFWTTYIDVTVTYPWDRSTLSFSAGTAMLLAALINLMFKLTPQFFVLAALIALCTGWQYSNAIVYRDQAARMNDYFWQLAWRMPGLEKGTILVSDDIPLDRYSDNDLTPIINWQFSPQLKGLYYDYKYFDLDLREDTFYSDTSSIVPVEHIYRNHQFYSSTDKTLAIYYRENNCLQTITSTDKAYPGLPDSLQHVADISDIDLIATNSEQSAMPPAPIGKEPEHGYCYYFQKIELALQANDTEKASDLVDQVISQELEPVNAADWMPVAETMIKAGDKNHLSKIVAR